MCSSSKSANTVLTNGNNYANTLSALLAGAPALTTAFPANNPLAAQLQTVAHVMSVRSRAGPESSDFLLSAGRFRYPFRAGGNSDPAAPAIEPAVLAFYQATQELGIDQSVTSFTASEFGRTLTPSGTDGSDHAWGNHHFIIGSSVAGGRFYGNFPLLAPSGPNDAGTRGVLLPTTAVDQYGATLAQWFGVAPATSPPSSRILLISRRRTSASFKPTHRCGRPR